MMNRQSTTLTTNLAPRPPLHPSVNRRTTSTENSSPPSPIQEKTNEGSGSQSPGHRSQDESTKTSDERSYLKSRRAAARNERRSNIIDRLNHNLNDVPLTAHSPQVKTDAHTRPSNPAQCKIGINDKSLNAFYDSQTTLGNLQPPLSQTSTATTATSTSTADDWSPSSSPLEQKETTHRRTMNIMNIFRRSVEKDVSSCSRSTSPAMNLRPSRIIRTNGRACKSSRQPQERSAQETKQRAVDRSFQQVLESHSKSQCRTMEDHKQLTMAKPKQQIDSGATHKTPNKRSQLNGSFESEIRQKSLLEDLSIEDSTGLLSKHQKKTFQKSKKKSTHRTHQESTPPKQEDKVKPGVDVFEKLPDTTGRIWNSDSMKESRILTTRKSSSQHSDGRNSHAESSKCLTAPSPPPPYSPKRKARSHSRSAAKPNHAYESDSNMDTISSPSPTVYHLLLTDPYGHAGFYTGMISEKTGKPHGYGKMSYQNTDKALSYEGEWNQGLWNGKGRHVKPNGDVYEGEFCDDQKHGTGIYRYKDGSRHFEGRYVMGDRVEGTMHYSDRSVYKGPWYHGKRQGKGVYRFSDNSIYKGDFDKDQIQGMGQLLWPNGSRYVGEWRRGKRHGKGKEYDKDGNVRFEGMWKDNKPLKDRG